MSQRFFQRCAFLIVMGMSSLTYAATHSSLPVGYWKTIDDITGKPKSILKISEAANGTLEGTVIKPILMPGEKELKICSKCHGERYNQPVIGMTIMWGFQWDGDRWEKGQILDPTSGKTYRCRMQLTEDKQHLKVHGYIGIPILGRTQVWEKVMYSEA